MATTTTTTSTTVMNLPLSVPEKLVSCEVRVDHVLLTQLLNDVLLAVRTQAHAIEHLQKDFGNKKIELDITMRNFKSDVENKIAAESQARRSGDAHLQQSIDALRSELDDQRRTNDARFNTDVGRVITDVNTMRQKAEDGLREVQALAKQLEEHTARVKGMEAGLQSGIQAWRYEMDGKVAGLEQQVKMGGFDADQLYALLSVKRESVAQANRSNTQTQLLHATQPFKYLLDQAAGLERKLAELRTALDGKATMAAVDGCTRAMKDQRADLETAMRAGDSDSVQQMRALLSDLSSKSVDFSALQNSLASVVNKGELQREVAKQLEAMKALMTEIAEHAANSAITPLQMSMKKKADQTIVDEKAEASALTDQQRTLHQLQRHAADLERELSELRQELMGSRFAATSDEAEWLRRLRADMAKLAEQLRTLEERTLSPSDLEDILGSIQVPLPIPALDLPKSPRKQKGSPREISERPQTAPSLPPQFKYDSQYQDSEPATLLQFRCLSCNRTAGPLVEQPDRRPGNQSEFPPSQMYNTARQVAAESSLAPAPPSARRKPRARSLSNATAVSNANLSSATRKKLTTYYEWLAARNTTETVKKSAPGGLGERERIGSIATGTIASSRGASPPADAPQSGHVLRSVTPPLPLGKDGRFYPGITDQPSYLQQLIAAGPTLAHADVLEVDLLDGDSHKL